MSWLAVINYHSHAGDLLRLLITSQPKPTGGLFSCSYRDQLMPGDMFTGPCVPSYVCTRLCVRHALVPHVSNFYHGAVVSSLTDTEAVFSHLSSASGL